MLTTVVTHPFWLDQILCQLRGWEPEGPWGIREVGGVLEEAAEWTREVGGWGSSFTH